MLAVVIAHPAKPDAPTRSPAACAARPPPSQRRARARPAAPRPGSRPAARCSGPASAHSILWSVHGRNTFVTRSPCYNIRNLQLVAVEPLSTAVNHPITLLAATRPSRSASAPTRPSACRDIQVMKWVMLHRQHCIVTRDDLACKRQPTKSLCMHVDPALPPTCTAASCVREQRAPARPTAACAPPTRPPSVRPPASAG